MTTHTAQLCCILMLDLTSVATTVYVYTTLATQLHKNTVHATMHKVMIVSACGCVQVCLLPPPWSSISWCVFLLSSELTEVVLFTVSPAAAMYVALIVLIFSMLSNCGVASN